MVCWLAFGVLVSVSVVASFFLFLGFCAEMPLFSFESLQNQSNQLYYINCMPKSRWYAVPNILIHMEKNEGLDAESQNFSNIDIPFLITILKKLYLNTHLGKAIDKPTENKDPPA